MGRDLRFATLEKGGACLPQPSPPPRASAHPRKPTPGAHPGARRCHKNNLLTTRILAESAGSGNDSPGYPDAIATGHRSTAVRSSGRRTQ